MEHNEAANMINKYLSRADVLRRMRRGDLPTQGGGYTSALFFDDGARTTGRIGHRLLREGLIERPEHSSVHSRYTLATEASSTLTDHIVRDEKSGAI